jgi:acyl-CoA synthetase (AMP-forming)/AMP-acid ligase II
MGPGHSLTEAQVIAFCESRIATFKVPRHVRFASEWPMSATKIRKYRLGSQLQAEAAHRSVAAVAP